jgi:hypothetical protein
VNDESTPERVASASYSVSVDPAVVRRPGGITYASPLVERLPG